MNHLTRVHYNLETCKFKAIKVKIKTASDFITRASEKTKSQKIKLGRGKCIIEFMEFDHEPSMFC